MLYYDTFQKGAQQHIHCNISISLLVQARDHSADRCADIVFGLVFLRVAMAMMDFEFTNTADVESKTGSVTTSTRSSDSSSSLASELMLQQSKTAFNLAAPADSKMCAVLKCPEKKNGKRSKYCRCHSSAHECIQRQHFPRMSL